MKPPLSRYVYALAFLLLAGYAFITLRGPRGVHALMDKKAQISELEQHNAELARRNEQKRDRIRRLQINPAEQELVIREHLKRAHPNEKIFILPDSDKKEPEKK